MDGDVMSVYERFRLVEHHEPTTASNPHSMPTP
jgi:hypothetical protein